MLKIRPSTERLAAFVIVYSESKDRGIRKSRVSSKKVWVAKIFAVAMKKRSLVLHKLLKQHSSGNLKVSAKAHSFGELKLPSSQTTLVRVVVATYAHSRRRDENCAMTSRGNLFNRHR